MDETMRRLFEATMVRLRPFGIEGQATTEPGGRSCRMTFRSRPVDRNDKQYGTDIALTHKDLAMMGEAAVLDLPDQWFHRVVYGMKNLAVADHAKAQEVPVNAQPR